MPQSGKSKRGRGKGGRQIQGPSLQNAPPEPIQLPTLASTSAVSNIRMTPTFFEGVRSFSGVRRELEEIAKSLEDREEEEGEERAWESTDSEDEGRVLEEEIRRLVERQKRMTREEWEIVGEFLLQEVAPMLGLVGSAEAQRVIGEILGEEDDEEHRGVVVISRQLEEFTNEREKLREEVDRLEEESEEINRKEVLLKEQLWMAARKKVERMSRSAEHQQIKELKEYVEYYKGLTEIITQRGNDWRDERNKAQRELEEAKVSVTQLKLQLEAQAEEKVKAEEKIEIEVETTDKVKIQEEVEAEVEKLEERREQKREKKQRKERKEKREEKGKRKGKKKAKDSLSAGDTPLAKNKRKKDEEMVDLQGLSLYENLSDYEKEGEVGKVVKDKAPVTYPITKKQPVARQTGPKAAKSPAAKYKKLTKPVKVEDDEYFDTKAFVVHGPGVQRKSDCADVQLVFFRERPAS
ncbi:hypothetical protein EV426DRAFT_576400 [Tirmania nivea]|nr:hypothetical protein EV426DRAFT_576400 [Tirmania nivea]